MRCFIVGNGPSLNRTNLDLIAGEKTFGVNQCHLIYPKTTWRPTYWVCTDRDIKIPIEPWSELFLSHYLMGEHCFVAPRHISRLKGLVFSEDTWTWWNKQRGWPEEWRRTIVPLPRFEELPLQDCTHGTRIGHYDKWPKAWHFPTLCVFAGSVITAIQLAVSMGFDEIYLVGCDASYKPNENNHFSEDYYNFRPYDAEWAAYLEEALHYAHGLAFKECSERGVKIYNAGVDGKLDAYPRIRLEDALVD